MSNGFAASAEECIEQADIVVITTPWDEFRGLSPQLLERCGMPRVVVDCWRVLEAERFQNVAQYVALGMGESC